MSIVWDVLLVQDVQEEPSLLSLSKHSISTIILPHFSLINLAIPLGRYDVELFQKIEQLIKKRMELFPADEETVLILLERVSEAQRHAAIVSIPYIHSNIYFSKRLWLIGILTY